MVMGNCIVLGGDFQSRKCPAGSLAIHPAYGLCEVLEADGFMRKLECAGDDAPFEVTADVRKLKHIDPLKDLQNDIV